MYILYPDDKVARQKRIYIWPNPILQKNQLDMKSSALHTEQELLKDQLLS